jgi:hypothetical protein
VNRVNQFRTECACVAPLERWTDGEDCADQQAQSDGRSNSPHGNFGDCGEWAQNTCPGWDSNEDVIDGCLQAMWDEGPGGGHFENMRDSDKTEVACGFFELPGGGVWASQNFR